MKTKKLAFLFACLLTTLTAFGAMGCERKADKESFLNSSSEINTTSENSSEISSELPSSSSVISSEASSVISSSEVASSIINSSSSEDPSSYYSSSELPISSSEPIISSSIEESSSSEPQPSILPIDVEFDNIGERVAYFLERAFIWRVCDEGGYYVSYKVNSGTPEANCTEVYNTLLGGGFTSLMSPILYVSSEKDDAYFAKLYFENEDNYVTIITYDEVTSTKTNHIVEIYVPSIPAKISEEDSHWLLLKDVNKLKEGDKILVAIPQNSIVAAGNIYGSTTSYFITGQTTFEDNEATSIPGLAIIFTLKQKGNNWLLITDNGKFGATGEQKMAWNSGTTEWSISIDSDNKATITANETNYKLVYKSSTSKFTVTAKQTSGDVLPTIYRQGRPEPIYPTSISIEGRNEISVGGNATLKVKYEPSDTNMKDVTWSSSNENVATVNEEGKVTGVAAGNAVITATAKDANGNDLTANHQISVIENTGDKWTLMIYMCGSDLESDSGLASEDITEMLSVKGQPDDVNIIIETGGATKWKNYNISNRKLGRYHIEDNELVLDASLSNASMGERTTFESFLTWGLTKYPAEKVGVVIWNHGGAMLGACSDDNYNGDSLLNSETQAAFQNILGNNKLEFIGYDCCLMQVQDIADFNAPYFNYMIASEESESGTGWVYDGLVEGLYNDQDTEKILTTVCDEFVNSYDEYDPDYNDQTSSFLDLSKMAAYKEEFEDLALSLKDTIKTSAFNEYVMNNVYFYGDSWVSEEDYQYYISEGYYTEEMFDPETINYDGVVYHYLYGCYDFGSFDAGDFLKAVKNYGLGNTINQKVDNVLAKLNDLIVYNKAGNIASASTGLALIFPVDEYVIDYVYKERETNFTNWYSAISSSNRVY